MRLDVLHPFAAANHGLVTRRAAQRTGVSTTAWYRALDSGVLQPIHPGVARMFGSAPTHEQHIAAAVLAAGSGAMASHRSAAYLWGVERPANDPVDIIVPSRGRSPDLDGVIVHRPRDTRDLTPVKRSNICTSNILRWLCDLGAVDQSGVSDAVGYVVTKALASPRALRTAIEVHARKGRHGVPAFRRALEEWLIDDRLVDSVLEKEMNSLVKRFRLPPVEFHTIICGYEVDFWVIGTPIVLECDGWGEHGRNRSGFERDRERDPILAGAGYVTIRFSYKRLIRDPGWVAKRIRDTLARWAPAVL